MQYTKADWEKNTIIKDSVHGYINVPKPIAKEIIDTDIFQRLKNIEQTGMQVLYPSATHNRFTHSLGVYHLSKKAFMHFKNNVQTDYLDVYRKVGVKYQGEGVCGAEGTWLRWELLFQLASLLHDCGHSPFSHTLEFVYDLVEEPETLSDKLMAKCSSQFRIDFQDQAEQNSQRCVGKPHERMSALFVATEESGSSGAELIGGFKSRIKKLMESYMAAYGIYNVYIEKSEIFNEDIEFMVRMIIGCTYELSHADDYAARKYGLDQITDWNIELQIRNCVIGMLNSKLDVDNLDYVVRDSKYSGYASNNIDLERLLASFTIINAYEFKSPIQLSKDVFFDASVNLDSFEGEFIDAKISGECMISSERDNLRVEGNIVTDREELSSVAERKIFRTKEEFSASVVLTEENNLIAVRPKNVGKKAYLNISGKLEGKFKGIILGNTCREAEQHPEARHRIFFAYKQNCMSVLMSAIDGSNFESKWVYAHHTTTFKNNYLIVYLLERYTEYLVDCEVKDFLETMDRFLDDSMSLEEIIPVAEEAIAGSYARIDQILQTYFPGEDQGYDALRTCLEDKRLGADAEYLYEFLDLYQILKRLEKRMTADKDKARKEKIVKIREQMCNRLVDYGEKGKFYAGSRLGSFRSEVYEKYKSLGALEIQCFASIMAMYEPVDIQGHYFYRTDDQDLLGEYKRLYQCLSASIEDDKYIEFKIAYRHMITRTSMSCLWKSYPEFNFYFSNWTKEELRELELLFRRTSTPWGNASGEKQLNYAILSDYVGLSENAEKLWRTLKEVYGLIRLVYVEQRIKTKSFTPYETYLSNHERVVRMEDIRLYPNHQSNVEFFYIFYERDYDEDKKAFTPNDFLFEVRKILDQNKQELEDVQRDEEEIQMDENGHVIIRDNVHGDITFPPLYQAIIDTKEFQRLRRIKQLAMAEKVFPGAVHTRFAHSIGTFYVMYRILKHFKEYFEKLNYHTNINDEENAILAAALLHDLGHGPYSHVFERTDLSLGCQSHEKWTVAIIMNPNTEIYSVLEGVEEGFAEKVAGYIECEKEAKKKSRFMWRKRMKI